MEKPYTGSITFTFEEISNLSRRTRDELLSVVFRKTSNGADVDIDATDLSTNHAERFIRGLSSKSLMALEAIIDAVDTRGFFLDADVVGKLKGDDVGGVWAGFSRRLRSVVDDDEAKLISWKKTDNGVREGYLHPTTLKNLKTALER